MIDYFALALGHGLLAIALLRLVMREGLDHDPLIAALNEETANNRKATSSAGRNAARRAQTGEDAPAGEEAAPPASQPAAPRKRRVRAAKR